MGRRRAAESFVLLPAVLALLLVLAATVAVGPAGAAGSDWDWPVLPRPAVGARFSPPAVPWLPGHRGVDLAVAVGTLVRAAGAGTVTFAGLVAGKPVVVVDHGGLRTTYEPVAATVTVGDRVSRGSPLGRTVARGGHCGAPPYCLHWGLIRSRTYLDTLRLLKAGPVVLKPP